MNAVLRGQLADDDEPQGEPSAHELAHTRARAEGVDGGAHGPQLPIAIDMDSILRRGLDTRRRARRER